MSSRQNGKSILYELDLSKLEQTAMLTLGKTIHDQVESEIESDVYAAMQAAILKGWTSRSFNAFPYIPPEPHLKSKVDRIIDKFWLSPCYDEMHLYLAQIQKKVLIPRMCSKARALPTITLGIEEVVNTNAYPISKKKGTKSCSL